MRLRELHDELVQLRSTLRIARRAEAAGVLLESSPQATRDSLTRIRQLPVGGPIDLAADAALRGPLGGWGQRAVVSPGDIAAVDAALLAVNAPLDGLIVTLASVLHEPPQLAIRLPAGDAVSDLAQALVWLDEGLVKPVRVWVGAEVVVVGVDRGSTWIELAVRELAPAALLVGAAIKPLGAAGLAFQFIKMLLTAVPKLVDDAVERERKIEEFRHTKVMNGHEELLSAAALEILANSRRELAVELVELVKTRPGPDQPEPNPEDIGRLERAIDMLQKLFAKGAKADMKRLPAGDTSAQAAEAKPATPPQLPRGDKQK